MYYLYKLKAIISRYAINHVRKIVQDQILDIDEIEQDGDLLMDLKSTLNALQYLADHLDCLFGIFTCKHLKDMGD